MNAVSMLYKIYTLTLIKHMKVPTAFITHELFKQTNKLYVYSWLLLHFVIE